VVIFIGMEERRSECVHYGVDYILVARASADTLWVQAEATGRSWTGSFPAAFVEEVTRKTGNSKRFNVYLRMLQAALDGSSRSVQLELVSHSQMEALRARRQPESKPDSPLYLILTYDVEFDKVHYPLPLQEEVREDAKALRLELEQQRAKSAKQMAQLQRINTELRLELEQARERMDLCRVELQSQQEELAEAREELHTTRVELQRFRALYQQTQAPNDEEDEDDIERRVAKIKELLQQQALI